MIKSFLFGMCGYPLLELMYRRRTHWTMALAGGLSMVLLRRIHRRHERRGLLWRCLLGSLSITAVEFAVGVVANRICKLGVWDYSQRRGNLLGQICPAFTAMWFALCLPVMAVLQRMAVPKLPDTMA